MFIQSPYVLTNENVLGWFRTTINFLDSIQFTDGLRDFRSQEFVSLASDIMSPVCFVTFACSGRLTVKFG